MSKRPTLSSIQVSISSFAPWFTCHSPIRYSRLSLDRGTALVCRVARTRGESERNSAGGSTQWCNAAIGQWATAQDGAAWRCFSTPRALPPHLFRLRTRCLSLSTPPLPHSSLVTSVAPLSLSIVPLSLPLTLSLSPCLSLTLFLGYCCIYSLPLLLSLVVSL